MKKDLLLILLIIGMVFCFSSCKTLKSSQMNQIFSEGLVINTVFDKDDFMIIGMAEGESEFVYYDSAKREYVGDSHKYGYVNERLSASVDNGFYIGIGHDNEAFYEPSSALEVAKLNALYNLITDAKLLGAHFIFEPNYLVEQFPDVKGKTMMYKVTVTALAGKVFYY